jgi:hypothetical protein
VTEPLQNRPAPDHSITRRAWFGWLASIGAAALVLIVVIVWNGWAFIRRRPARTSLPGRRRNRAAARNAAAKFATANHNLLLVQHHAPKEVLKSSVVHWPHPKLFKNRPQLTHNPKPLPGNEWQAVVQARCQPAQPPPTATHFAALHEGTIRENLALSKLTFTPKGELQNVDAALAILAPLFDDDRQRCNLRLYHLYGTLVSWKEPNPEAAYKAVIGATWKRPAESRPAGLQFLQDLAKFTKWHQNRARRESSINQLRKRIAVAQWLRGQSSSGQDTAQAERDRSNRPRPLTPDRRETRTRKLARRKQRRAERNGRKSSLALFWNRLRLHLGIAAPQSEKKAPRRDPKCPVSTRNVPCFGRASRRLGSQ